MTQKELKIIFDQWFSDFGKENGRYPTTEEFWAKADELGLIEP